MDKFVGDHVKEFWGGFIVGCIAGLKLLFTGNINWDNIAIEYTVRFFGVCFFGFTTAVITALATDIYKYKIKHWLFPKSKQHDKEENDKDSKAA